MTAEIGVNIASYLPDAVLFPQWADTAASEAQYTFWQILPLRSLGPQTLRLPVWYLEEAWDKPRSFREVVQNELRRRFYHQPGGATLIDWVAFGTEPHIHERYERLLAMYGEPYHRPKVILHREFAQGRLTEVSPQLWLTPDEIIQTVVGRRLVRPLVIDLWHLRRQPTPKELLRKPSNLPLTSPLGQFWQESLPKLLPHASVIHVSPRRDDDELRRCLTGKRTDLEEMLRYIRQSMVMPVGIYVVEITLGMIQGAYFPGLARTLSEFRQWLVSIVG